MTKIGKLFDENAKTNILLQKYTKLLNLIKLVKTGKICNKNAKINTKSRNISVFHAQHNSLQYDHVHIHKHTCM